MEVRSQPVIPSGLLCLARRVVDALAERGHEAWLVGGCVRDGLLGVEVKDVDVATSARPDEVRGVFPEVRLVGASFGVALVRVDRGEPWVEVATFRRDGSYSDRRRPDSVEYGSLVDDALRRDFTVNALYWNPATGDIVDHAGGLDDLRAGVLRTVGVPARRFGEDALRLLRAVRFAARLGFEIEPVTWAALCDLAPTISHVSPERIRDELTLILVGGNRGRALRLLEECGLLGEVLPEVAALRGVEQGRRHHPEGDALTHTMLVVDKLEKPNVVSAWAALLHDIGKAPTFRRDESGNITFYGHDAVGARMAEAVCQRLRFSRDETERISSVVGRHMRFISATEWNRSTMRRFIAADTIEDDLAVHRADAMGSNGKLGGWEAVRRALDEVRAEGGEAIPPRLITGRDVIAAGVRPGPGVAAILEQIQEAQLDGRLTTRDEALAEMRRLAAAL